jgi:hypothetical protein
MKQDKKESWLNECKDAKKGAHLIKPEKIILPMI